MRCVVYRVTVNGDEGRSVFVARGVVLTGKSRLLSLTGVVLEGADPLVRIDVTAAGFTSVVVEPLDSDTKDPPQGPQQGQAYGDSKAADKAADT